MSKKWILITGGSRGIGRSLVTELLSSWNVIFTGRTETGLSDTLAEAAKIDSPFWARGYACDGKNEVQVEELSLSLLEEFGPPTAIIHNAGIARDALHIHQNADVWLDVINTNLVAIINWNRHLVPPMLLEGYGSIVLMSSITGLKGNIGQTAYAASKSAMFGVARSLAHEVGRFGIRVNCVAPGLIESDMTEAIPVEKLKAMKKNIPLRRLGRPEEVAKVVEFLIGENSQYITGQTIILDGGATA
ncbi:3-oxoacyl-[acyl-carrier-protein] reductase FabG-like [Teleopsis dalmanni]|uniref:3-oxoacyl-[acyl-carrier-protein] reductase FabG-like n=1 Tax=Teleopsis dalmanni TaxID=139649 RepID=UPI0018CCAA28|nr:3-oxoacyl-[acyl-carrier-protein] reductase FabG-like [Teleopsis dalmanni]